MNDHKQALETAKSFSSDVPLGATKLVNLANCYLAVVEQVADFQAAQRQRNVYHQHTLMLFDPQTGEPKPYPSEAAQYRVWHGLTAWLYNPWTGSVRNAQDVGSDVQGLLIQPPGEPVHA